jgi:hypothetical protein
MKYLKLFEEYTNQEIETFFHGTRSNLPFDKFSKSMDGSGLVSMGKKYGGFFFTSSEKNSRFYAENWVAEVSIDNIENTDIKRPQKALDEANKNNTNYMIDGVLDGVVISDVVVVPNSNLDDVKILNWVFVGDKEFYFEQLDNMFGDEEDDYFVNQYMIHNVLDIIGGFDYLYNNIPLFKEYYDSKM